MVNDGDVSHPQKVPVDLGISVELPEVWTLSNPSRKDDLDSYCSPGKWGCCVHTLISLFIKGIW